MEDQEIQLHVKRVTEKLTESLYVLHFRRSLPGLVLHETDMQLWEEPTWNRPCIYLTHIHLFISSAVKSMTNSSLHFKSRDGLSHQHERTNQHLPGAQVGGSKQPIPLTLTLGHSNNAVYLPFV
uniref:Uncharacterized protein n=1 Tax=Oncorhynchus kisutch TaxID=8019 RepID=A0A8C7F3S2_ONCKI